MADAPAPSIEDILGPAPALQVGTSPGELELGQSRPQPTVEDILGASEPNDELKYNPLFRGATLGAYPSTGASVILPGQATPEVPDYVSRSMLPPEVQKSYTTGKWGPFENKADWALNPLELRSKYRAKQAEADYRTWREKNLPVLGPIEEAVGSAIPVGLANAVTPGLPLLADAPWASRIASMGIWGAESGALQHPLSEGRSSLISDVAGGAGASMVLGAGGELLHNAFYPRVLKDVAETGRDASDLGVYLHTGQMTTNKTIRGLDEALAKGGNDSQLEAFNGALGEVIGVPGVKALNEDVYAQGWQQATSDLDQVALASGPIPVSRLGPFRASIAQRARALPPGERAAVEDALESITRYTTIAGTPQAPVGVIRGQDFQALTARGSSIMNLSKSSNSEARRLGGEIADQLMQELGASSPPGLVDDLRDARNRIKALYTIQPLVEKQVSGRVDPRQLLQAVRGVYGDFGKGAPAPGSEDMFTLARVGQLLPGIDVTGAAKEGRKMGFFKSLGWLGGAAGAEALAHLNPDLVFPAIAALAAGKAASGGAGPLLASRRWADRTIENALTPSAARQVVPGMRIPLATAAYNQLAPGAGGMNLDRLREQVPGVNELGLTGGQFTPEDFLTFVRDTMLNRTMPESK